MRDSNTITNTFKSKSIFIIIIMTSFAPISTEIKTKGLSKLVIVKQCVSRQWMDEEARRLRRIGKCKIHWKVFQILFQILKYLINR